MKRLWILLLTLPLVSFATSLKYTPDDIEKYLAQYVPYDMVFDASELDANDKAILKKLVEASKIVDEIYWRQTSLVGMQLKAKLLNQPKHPHQQALITLLKRNAGPYEKLNNHKTFLGDSIYFPGNELYPRGFTAQIFDEYIKDLSQKEREEFLSPFTVIQKSKDGFKAVPYHKAYHPQVQQLSKKLLEAAALSKNPSFKKYLTLKAKALLNDDYYEADLAWIDLTDNQFDMVVGPFETYSDGIKGIKAKYESFVEVVDEESSKQLELYTQYLADFEANLPIPEAYKSEVDGLTAKFVIVQDVHRGGDAASGYQPIAANLPNDPRVHANKGTVKTFWKNMFKARFDAIITPVAEELIASNQQNYLSDDGFFQFVLMHEISHAIGPRTVKAGPNKGKAVNEVIGPMYSALEEAKADVTGLYSLVFLMKKDVVSADREPEYYVSYLGSLLRTIRFGLKEAHGKAAAIQLNYLSKMKGLTFDSRQVRWAIDVKRMRQAIALLTQHLLILEAEGKKTDVESFFKQWALMSHSIRMSINKVKHLPTDVIPNYSIKWNG